jgi:hypothetical protein
MAKIILSPEQAFQAMSLFLCRYYERTGGKGELAAILGDIQMDDEYGRPFDPAAWDDWLAAINHVLKRPD